MKAKRVQSFNTNGLWLMALVMLFVSCEKNLDNNGEAIVRINLQGVAINDPKASLSTGRNQVQTANNNRELVSGVEDEIQRFEVPFDENYKLEVTVAPQEYSINSNISQTSVSTQSNNGQRASVTTTYPGVWHLPVGVRYRVVVYRRDGNIAQPWTVQWRFVSSASNEYVVTDADDDSPREFSLTPGYYRFMVYSIGSTTNTPPEITTDPWQHNPPSINIDGDTDFMYFTQDMEVLSGFNNLDITLKHLFSQITTTINATAVGEISTATAHITPHHTSATISFAFDNATATVGRSSPANRVVPFSQSLPNLVATSDSVIVCNDGSTASTLTFSHLRIANISKFNVSVPDITLQPGRRYILTLNVTRFSTEGGGGGGVEWASGNLRYDLATSTYGFASNQWHYGDYWFPDYLLPKRLDGTNQAPSPSINGDYGDPCSQVLPVGTWRLPTATEMNSIRTETEGSPTHNRFGTRYDGTTATDMGVFFGTRSLPPEEQRDYYLFLPYGGSYNNSNSLSNGGSQGLYLLSSGSAYSRTEFGGAGSAYFNAIGSAGANNAYQIRCVRVTTP